MAQEAQEAVIASVFVTLIGLMLRRTFRDTRGLPVGTANHLQLNAKGASLLAI